MILTVHGSFFRNPTCGDFAPRRVGAFRKFWSGAKMQKILQHGGQMIFSTNVALSKSYPRKTVNILAEA